MWLSIVPKNRATIVRKLLTFVVLIGVVATADYVGVRLLNIGTAQVSGFYFGAALFTVISFWFRWWGSLAIYIGIIVSSGISGPLTFLTFVLSLGNVIASAIPRLFFGYFKMDYRLRKTRDYIGFLISASVVQGVVSATWILGGLYIAGIVKADALPTAILVWLTGDAVVSILFGVPLLKFGSPKRAQG